MKPVYHEVADLPRAAGRRAAVFRNARRAARPRFATRPRWVTTHRALLPLALLLALLATGCPRPAETPLNHPAVGQSLDEVQLSPLLGAAEPLDGDRFAGRVTLLHFWGTWCPPCRTEYPELLEAAGELVGQEDFRFVTVSAPGSPDETFESLQNETAAYYQSLGADVPTHADPHGITQTSVVGALGRGGMAYPTTLLLDRAGVIRGVWEGYHPEGVDQMHRAALDLLEQDAPPAA